MEVIKTTDLGVIKFANLDAVAGNTLAKMLEVPHKELKKIIERTIDAEKNRKKQGDSDTLVFNAVFKDWTFKNKMNREYDTYVMNEDALYLVISNTQSEKAHELKVLFKSEFNKMRMEREARDHIKAQSKRLHESLQPLKDGLKEMYPDSSIGPRIFQHIHEQINLAVIGRARGINRDELDLEVIEELERLEACVAGYADETLDYNPEAVRTVLFKWIQGQGSTPQLKVA